MLTLAPIFSDHAVLQRGKPIRIFGTADAASVTVRLGCRETTAAVRSDGKWTALLPPMTGTDPMLLYVTDGASTLVREDILLGEVWLCGGQSNMELVLRDSRDPEPALAECASLPIRLYHVGKRGFMDEQFYEEERRSCWQLPSADACQWWTAVGYHFAAELTKKLGCPVGLVECNCGGTSASAWISEEMLRSNAVGQAYLDDYARGMKGLTDEEACRNYLDYCEYQGAWQKRIDDLYREHPDMPWATALEICGENQYPGPPAPNNPLRPHGLYDTMLTRIAPYTLKGVLWYQGEADEIRPEGYAQLLTTLIRQWRRDFMDQELPFLIVQLPMHAYADNTEDRRWPVLRLAQEEVFRNVKNTGLAVILDCGEFNEIHPKEKRTPAHRLFLQAMERVYRHPTDNNTAPLVRGIVPEDGGIRVYFWHVDKGLELRGESGFEVCDAAGNWHPAQAEIVDVSLAVRSEAVPHPVGVRYAWVGYGEVTLFTREGMPAAPFCRMV